MIFKAQFTGKTHFQISEKTNVNENISEKINEKTVFLDLKIVGESE